MTSENIRNRQWTEAEKETVRRLAAKQAAGDDSISTTAIFPS
jgi:hypothetical protein